MTLLISVFAAAIFTLVWYKNEQNTMLLHIPCFMFWGASIMWLTDAIYEYAELGAEYFTPAPVDMLNDLFLGLSVVAFALMIWIVVLLIKDPSGRVRRALFSKK